MQNNNILEWKKYEFYMFRIMVTTIFLIYRILIFFCLINLFNDSYIKTFSLLILSLMVQLVVGSTIIYQERQNQDLLSIIFWEVFYWIPRDRQNQYTVHKVDPVSYIPKILIPLVENIVFLQIIIFDDCKEDIVYQVFQIACSLQFCILIEIDNWRQKSFKETISNCAFKCVMMNLIFGYFLLCHRSRWIYIYDIMVLVVSFGLLCSNTFSQKFLKFGYHHDILDSRLVQLVQTGLIVQNLGFYQQFKTNQKEEKDQQQFDQTNILCGIQVLQLIIFILFDSYINDNTENNIYRTILHIYLISIMMYLAKVWIWFVRYVFYGPFRREVQIDCLEIVNSSIEKVEQDYFRFNSLQQSVTVYFTNFLPSQFEKIISFLLKQNIALNIYMGGNLELNSFLTKKLESKIILKLMSNEFTTYLINSIMQNKHFNYMYSVQVNSSYSNIILNNFINNYQIIPNILIHESQLNKQTFFVISEVCKLITYNKLIKEEMSFQPVQIYYDLFDY